MKTIRVIFTKTKQDPLTTGRVYSFNTELDVEVGDMLVSPEYKGNLLQIIAIEPKLYRYFRYRGGVMLESWEAGCGDIKELSSETIIIDEEAKDEPDTF